MAKPAQTPSCADCRMWRPRATTKVLTAGSTSAPSTTSDPGMRAAPDDGGVHVIVCPVDYRENMALTDRLGDLDVVL